MATATETISKVELAHNRSEDGELRFVIHNVSWEKYESLLEIFGDDGPRMNYSDGSLELMSPLIPHEEPAELISYMIEALTDELDIRRNALGSTTFRRRLAKKGVEPDKCFYIANAGAIKKGQRSPNLDVDPPPDLAIEIEITHSLLDKLGIYAGIGVPELWRYDGETLTVMLLQTDGTYAASETSLSFPFLPMAEFVRFLHAHDPEEETRWGRSFRAWVREVLLPRFRQAEGEQPDS
jgi:Uma2 family endonuclease